MASLQVHYKAIDPYYSSHDQVFIAESLARCEDLMFDYEDYLGRNHGGNIGLIYERTILNELDF